MEKNEIHLMYGYHENKRRCSAFTQTQWMNDEPFESELHLEGIQKNIWRNHGNKNSRMFLVMLILLLLLTNTAIGILLGLKLLAGPHLCVSCPGSWVGYEGRCYYFSEAEGTWNSCQSSCSSYNASLASIDTQQEMEFVMRYKGRADYWIGLHREEVGKLWKWTNGSVFNDWFKVAADGLCAYLDDDVSSTWCNTQRNWICTKSSLKRN